MMTVYVSSKEAIRTAKNLTKTTGHKHVVRPVALGNKVAYEVVDVERFAACPDDGE